MGKLTAEQKVREYNRGQKAAREGRSRSWSEPWAYPFESNQHYEERREAFNVCPAISSVITVKRARVQAPNVVDSGPKASTALCFEIVAPRSLTRMPAVSWQSNSRFMTLSALSSSTRKHIRLR